MRGPFLFFFWPKKVFSFCFILDRFYHWHNLSWMFLSLIGFTLDMFYPWHVFILEMFYPWHVLSFTCFILDVFYPWHVLSLTCFVLDMFYPWYVYSFLHPGIKRSLQEPTYCTALHCTVLHDTALYCKYTAQHCAYLHPTSLRCTVLYFCAVCFTEKCCITRHWIALNCTARTRIHNQD